jgi:hypothetical protein
MNIIYKINYIKMQTLRNDELFLLAIDLSLPDLLNFCSSSKQINLSVCDNDRFWLQKLNKDFPGWNTMTNVSKTFLGFSYETSLKDPKFSKRFDQLKSNKDKYILFYNTKNFSILKEKLHLK